MRAGTAIIALVLLAGLLTWSSLGGDDLSNERSKDDEDTAGDLVATDAETLDPAEGSTPTLSGTAGKGDWTIVLQVRTEDGPLREQDVEVELETKDSPRWTRTTDTEGVVTLGPFLPPFLSDGVGFHVETKTHESESGLRATFDGGQEMVLRADVQLTKMEFIFGQVVLPDGVPSAHAYAWIHGTYNRDHDHRNIMGNAVPLDAQGRFSIKWDSLYFEEDDGRYGIEATIAHEGKRWYGYASGSGPKTNLRVNANPIQRGDPAVVRVSIFADGREVTDGGAMTRFSEATRWSHGYGLPSDMDVEDCFLWDPKTEIYVQAWVRDPKGYGHAVLGPLSAETTDVVISASPERALRGRVLSAEGKGVPAAEVTATIVILTSGDGDIGFLDETATTDDTGGFVLKQLGPYPYWVTATVADASIRIESALIDKTQDQVTLRVRPFARARIEVLDERGQAVEGARVAVDLPPPGITLDPKQLPLRPPWNADFDRIEHHETDINGRADFVHLDTDRKQRLLVSPPTSRPELAPFELQGWTTKDDTIRLRAGLTISGRVVDDDGSPIESTWVTLRRDGERKNFGTRYRRIDGSEDIDALWTHADNAFVIGPLPAGTYWLRAEGGGEVKAQAGDVGVVLRGRSSSNQVWLPVRVTDWRAADRGAWLLLRSRHRMRAYPIGPDGRLVVPHVRESELPELWITGLSAGRYVWRAVVDVRGVEDELVLSSASGGTIEGRIVVPDGVTLDSWHVEPVGPVLRTDRRGRTMGGFACAYGDDKQSFTLTGVPPGPWTVKVVGRADKRELTGTVQARVGSTISIELR